jgi:hypothetical protein
MLVRAVCCKMDTEPPTEVRVLRPSRLNNKPKWSRTKSPLQPQSVSILRIQQSRKDWSSAYCFRTLVVHPSIHRMCSWIAGSLRSGRMISFPLVVWVCQSGRLWKMVEFPVTSFQSLSSCRLEAGFGPNSPGRLLVRLGVRTY